MTVGIGNPANFPTQFPQPGAFDDKEARRNNRSTEQATTPSAPSVDVDTMEAPRPNRNVIGG